MVTPYDRRPTTRCWSCAREQRHRRRDLARSTRYVTGRMVSLSVPVREVMSRDPLTVRARRPADRHRRADQGRPLRAAIAVDDDGAPVGLVTRADLVNPRRAACCWSTTPSRPRACRASSRRRSWRSSTTTTSARSRPASRWPRPSTRSAAPRRWWWSASARTDASRSRPRRRCCSRRCSRTRSS